MPSRALKSRIAKSNCIKGNPICGFFLGVTGFRKDDCLLTLCLLTLHMIRHNVLDKFYSQIEMGVLEFWNIFQFSITDCKIQFPKLRYSFYNLFTYVYLISMLLKSLIEQSQNIIIIPRSFLEYSLLFPLLLYVGNITLFERNEICACVESFRNIFVVSVIVCFLKWMKWELWFIIFYYFNAQHFTYYLNENSLFIIIYELLEKWIVLAFHQNMSCKLQ